MISFVAKFLQKNSFKPKKAEKDISKQNQFNLKSFVDVERVQTQIPCYIWRLNKDGKPMKYTTFICFRINQQPSIIRSTASCATGSCSRIWFSEIWNFRRSLLDKMLKWANRLFGLNAFYSKNYKLTTAGNDCFQSWATSLGGSFFFSFLWRSFLKTCSKTTQCLPTNIFFPITVLVKHHPQLM